MTPLRRQNACSQKHRLECCPYPGAKLVQSLKRKLRKALLRRTRMFEHTRPRQGWLLQQGFARRPKKCSRCSDGKVDGPLCMQRKRRQPFWHWRCQSWQCQHRVSFLDFSIFSGLRLEPRNLVSFLRSYCVSNLRQPLSVEDLMKSCNTGRTQAHHFLQSLVSVEADAGKKWCSTAVLRKNIECDATSLKILDKGRQQALRRPDPGGP